MLKIDTKDTNGTSFNEKEVTAYIQQQMIDLAPHLKDKSALQVKLSQKNQVFEAELTAFQEEGDIQTVGLNKNLFDAIRNAKEGLLQYFVETEATINPHLREEKIQHLSHHGNLYLH